MAKMCNGCGTSQNVTIPYAVHESDMARSERNSKRLWIVILVLIGALIGSNIAWIVYESQFEDVSVCQEIEQQAESGNNIAVGGDYYGEADN